MDEMVDDRYVEEPICDACVDGPNGGDMFNDGETTYHLACLVGELKAGGLRAREALERLAMTLVWDWCVECQGPGCTNSDHSSFSSLLHTPLGRRSHAQENHQEEDTEARH